MNRKKHCNTLPITKLSVKGVLAKILVEGGIMFSPPAKKQQEEIPPVEELIKRRIEYYILTGR